MVRDTKQQGFVAWPLLILTLILFWGGFRAWSFLRHWRLLTEIQLNLDRCVGQTTQDLREILRSLGTANKSIRFLRASARVVQFIQPEFLPGLQLGIRTFVAYQEVTLWKWRARQGQWFLNNGCGYRGDKAPSLPSLSFIRQPPDDIGPKPLEWPGGIPRIFKIQLDHSPRHAAALVQAEAETETRRGDFDHEEDPGKRTWKIQWSAPERKLWPGFL